MSTGKLTETLTVDSLVPMPPQVSVELEPGDEIISIEGMKIGTEEGAFPLHELAELVPSQATLTYEVLRGGEAIFVEGPQLTSTRVGAITPRSAADDARLQIGDVVLTMNGGSVYTLFDMIDVVDAVQDQEITIEIWRDGDVLVETLVPRMTAIEQDDGSFLDEPKIGVASDLPFEFVTTRVGVFEAFVSGWHRVWLIITQSLKAMKAMIYGKISTCNLNGPVGIAETSGSMARQGPMSFVLLIASLSTAVGLLNLFPIPVLDGGHLVFHAYEAVTGKMPSDGALRIFMAIGIALIGTMMVFAIGNDLLFCP